MNSQGAIVTLFLIAICIAGGFAWQSSMTHQQLPAHADRLLDVATSSANLAAAAIDSGGALTATSSTYTDARLGKVVITVTQSATVVTASAIANGTTRTATAKL